MDKKTTSWGKVAEWYDGLLDEGKDTYQSAVVLPNLIRILSPKQEEVVADIACGQGFFTSEIAKMAKKAIGVDVSPELVSIAKDKNSAKNIEYFVSPSHDLGKIPAQSVDKAVTVLALQNIEKLGETAGEVGRILKSGGSWIVVLNHPAFRIPKRSSWEWDEKQKKQYRRLDGYMSESREVIDMNPGEKDQKKKISTISFHRPLQVYFKAFSKHGLSVSRLEEWISHKESRPEGRGNEENRMKKEIPMFLALEMRRV